MAADRATVSVTASLLPDYIKTTIGGNVVYDLNDEGNSNKWISVRMTVNTTARDLVTTGGVQYVKSSVAHAYNATPSVTLETTDDVVFLVIKNTGTSDGSTTSTAKLYVGLSNGDIAQDSGTIVINPNEVWHARLRGEQLDDINCASSTGDLVYDVFAVLDDGGV